MAYKEMIRKFKEVDPSATKETVTTTKKKINSIRTVYQKELKKF